MAKNTVSSFNLANRIPSKDDIRQQNENTFEDKPVLQQHDISDVPSKEVESSSEAGYRDNSIIEITSRYAQKRPPVREKRTKRVNLLLEPTNYRKLQVILEGRNQSVNDFVNEIISEFVKANY